MKIENEIISSVIAAVKELYGQDVPEKMVALQKTKSNFEGNLTLVVFPFLKMSKKKPEDTAQEIGEYLKKNCCNVIADFNVVKGFLNLSIAPAAWVGLLNTINADPKFGEKPVTEQSPLVMISTLLLTLTSLSTSVTCATTSWAGHWLRLWRPTATR